MEIQTTTFRYNDGGRSTYFKASACDCVTRAIAIATGNDYREVYKTAKKIIGYTPRNGVKKTDTRKLMAHFGGTWTPLMVIGSGCKVHLNREELPKHGRYVLNLSGHVSAYIDGVINDTYDCSRDGKRCVYGYWEF